MKKIVFLVVVLCAIWMFFQWHVYPRRPSALYLTWLHDPTTSMAVQWHNEEGRVSTVFYQKEGDAAWQAQQGAAHSVKSGTLIWGELFVHTVELRELLPDTVYCFRLEGDSQVHRFRTLPRTSTRPIHFVVGGDIYQDDIFRFKKMNKQAAKLDPDFIVLGGDIAYTRGHNAFLKGRFFEIKRWQTFFRAWSKQMHTSSGLLIPLVAVIGNHDLESTHPDPRIQPVLFYEFFALPKPYLSYRTLDCGDYLSLILLDTGHTYPIAGAQTEWLERTLGQRQITTHKVAIYHVGAYPSAYDYQKGNSRHVRRYWTPLFEQYGVKTAFEHHDHTFKRTHRLKGGKIDPEGVLYLGDGAWAVVPRTPKSPSELWYIAKSASVNFVYLVSLQGPTQIIQAIDHEGRIFDEVASVNNLKSK